MERPPDLFDRVDEWKALADFARRPGPGAQLAIVRGRRRQGKSFLLRRLAEATGGFYHQASEEGQALALASLGSALGEHANVPGGRIALTDWQDAVETMFGLSSPGRPKLVVIDEFPYLLSHSPELPSLLQRAIDRSRDGGAPIRLVLCGSALSVMAALLTGSQALRGRAMLDVVVQTFDHRAAADFWGIGDAETAFLVHAVLGGTPGYRDLLPGRPPRRRGDLARWLAEGPLNPASAMFREDDYLLAEERSLTDRSLYHSVVAAIANGQSTQSGIAAFLGREARAVQHALAALESSGFVARTADALRSRRPIYSVADPIVRFHHVVTRRDLARFEDRRPAAAWNDAQPRFRTHVLGPHFEELARAFAFRWAAPETIGGVPSEVAPAVVNDARSRSQHEIDVVVLARAPDGSQSVVALGEAKHSTAKRTIADVERLERIRDLVAAKVPSAAQARLLVFSGSGFDVNLARLGQRDDVELIDIDRMYHGS